ncbi:hypothetical protein O181_126296 [Austropuccinia psidii MF-1]|uniref:Uncharacterized protein n=1 Tax=Austropuccinia psidii MF-1 TaxID=1389203 RepID=A0A9Q3Q5T0_9BASI|nr:hypothetical protein [Austropuccinia psidii MF-1]
MMDTTIPPASSIPIMSFPKANLVKSTLALFDKSIHPNIPSSILTNGIHGPTLSEITSIFGDPVPPLIDSSQISSPIPNPPPPYKPRAVSPLPPTLPSRCDNHFNQIYKEFDRLFQHYVQDFHETAASSSNPTSFCCLRLSLHMVMEFYNQMSE